MVFDPAKLSICCSGAAFAEKAGEILRAELLRRCEKSALPGPGLTLELSGDEGAPSDAFTIERTDAGLRFRGTRLRALLYAVGLFLRKTEVRPDAPFSAPDLRGTYAPAKAVRGHQLGYRPLSNTYDKWTQDDFVRYMTELIFFGMNTVELIPIGQKNELTVTDPLTMASSVSALAHGLDLDVSLWIPNGDGDEETELAEREEVFRRLPHIDALFIPGADPGSLPAKTLVDRCLKLKKLLETHHPQAGLWVSAQAPHGDKGWGETFVQEVNAHKEAFAGVVQGPNRAFDIEVLRKKLDPALPIRYYPDICHVVRCEYPLRDVSHVFRTGLGREPVCPRPLDYKALHERVSPYTLGSVTYSDGVNDDVNKAVWCALEWDPDLSPAEILEDYVRLYLPGRDVEKLTAGILNAEKSFHRAPADPRHVFTLYALTPETGDNDWRAQSLYFLAQCFDYLRTRFLEDSAASAFPEHAPIPSPALQQKRRALSDTAKLLFDTIGMQLSVKEFFAYGAERGAVLDTIDLPVTDRERKRALFLENADLLPPEEEDRAHEDCVFYHSFALDPLEHLGAGQPGDYYLNFLGDKPKVNDGTLPVRLFCAFDHYTLDLDVLLAPEDHQLVLTVYRLPSGFSGKVRATLNGVPVGPFYETAPRVSLPKDFSRIALDLPGALTGNGRLRLHIEEAERGFQTAEIRIVKKN